MLCACSGEVKAVRNILAWLQAGQDDDPVLEEALGFGLFSQGPAKLGWLMNLNEVRPF